MNVGVELNKIWNEMRVYWFELVFGNANTLIAFAGIYFAFQVETKGVSAQVLFFFGVMFWYFGVHATDLVALVTVSYTHLDVYKRQAPLGMASAPSTVVALSSAATSNAALRRARGPSGRADESEVVMGGTFRDGGPGARAGRGRPPCRR